MFGTRKQCHGSLVIMISQFDIMNGSVFHNQDGVRVTALGKSVRTNTQQFEDVSFCIRTNTLGISLSTNIHVTFYPSHTTNTIVERILLHGILQLRLYLKGHISTACGQLICVCSLTN